MELRQYLFIFKRWAWLLIIGAMLGVAGGYVGSLYQTPIYQSTTKALISRPPDQRISDPYSSYYDEQQTAITYTQLILTQPVLEKVSQQLGFQVSAGQINVQQTRDTQIVSVTVEDPDPQRAASIANTLIRVFIQYNEDLQTGRYQDSEDSIQTQLKQVEGQISSIQTEIDQLSNAGLEEQKTKVGAQIDVLQSQITELKVAIVDLQPKAKTSWQPTPTLTSEEYAAVQEKQAQLDELEPVLKQYQQIYANMLVQGIDGVGSTDSRLTSLQTNLALYQQIHSNLLNSYENIRLERLRTTTNIVQLERAEPASGPVRPKPLTNIALGCVVGIMLAAGVVTMIEYLDDTIKTPDDIARLMNITVVGYIGKMPGMGKKKAYAYVAEQPRSPIAEAYRALRTSIEFASSEERPLRSILIASAGPGEGKTTTATNLTIVMAQGGKNVVLVDADMRRPSIHRMFGLQNRIGLSTLFSNGTQAAEVQHPWRLENMKIITSGGLPNNPSELLSSEKMVKILSKLEETSDIVVIDSPPFLVTDASVLASRVDGVVLVVEPGKTTRDSVMAVLNQLQRANANVIGVVFNRIDRNRAYAYGGYRYYTSYYRYHMGYHYYGEDNAQREGEPGRKGPFAFFRHSTDTQVQVNGSGASGIRNQNKALLQMALRPCPRGAIQLISIQCATVLRG